MSELRALLNVTAIALACGAALAGTHWLTEEKIRFNETARLRDAIVDLLPAGAQAPSVTPALEQVPAAWQLCNGFLLGRSNARGYGGDIRLLYALRPAGDPMLTGVTVLGHAETPGLADFVTDPDWLGAFTQRSATDIDGLAAVTGATITSRAVADHLAAVLRNPDETLGQPVSLECGK
jgi:Na+-translocating ferredoxin:NAD+ oxidoreductase RnfG subunit